MIETTALTARVPGFGASVPAMHVAAHRAHHRHASVVHRLYRLAEVRIARPHALHDAIHRGLMCVLFADRFVHSASVLHRLRVPRQLCRGFVSTAKLIWTLFMDGALSAQRLRKTRAMRAPVFVELGLPTVGRQPAKEGVVLDDLLW